jgi:hypothetical protein
LKRNEIDLADDLEFQLDLGNVIFANPRFVFQRNVISVRVATDLAKQK